jgi:hypothetical protein
LGVTTYEVTSVRAMKRIITANILFFIALTLLGCASSQETQGLSKKFLFSYLDCVKGKSAYLDDGMSSMENIANGAILVCSKEEEALIHLYSEPSLKALARRKQREGAYVAAIIGIKDNRMKMAGNKKNNELCPMQTLHDSCYKVGYIRKSEVMCSEISESMKDVSSKTIMDKAALMGVQALCYQWCANGIYDKPVESSGELCK